MRPDSLVSFPVPVQGLMLNLPPQNVPPQGLLDGQNMFVDNDGFFKPRFGYSSLAGLVQQLGGRVTIPGGQTGTTVNLPVPQPTNTYPLILAIHPVGGAPDVAIVWHHRTTTSFQVTISADPAPDSVDMFWFIPPDTELNGVVELTSGVTSFAVVFGTPQVAANYLVTLGVGLGIGSPSGQQATWDTPTVTGFTIRIGADPGVGNSILVAWSLTFPEPVPNTNWGTLSFTGVTTQQNVVLAVPQANAGYGVVMGVHTGTGGVGVVGAVQVAPTTVGFDIRISAAPGAETVLVDWRIFNTRLARVGEPILGGIGFYDKSGTIQYVIATPTKWYRLDASLPSWVDITDPANPLSGTLDDQVRFVAFPYLGDIWCLGVNNTNPLRAWRPGDLTYTAFPNMPIARDIEVVGSRAVVINTVEGGVRFSYRIRWSNINDFTTFQALSDHDATDLGQPLVAIRKTTGLAAAIYGVQGMLIMSDQPGNDATAFRFDNLNLPSTPGPCSPATVISAVGLHYYQGLDARIYQFDGTSVVPISTNVDALLQQVTSLGFAGRFHGVFNQSLRQLWFHFVRSPDTEPRWAVVYNVDAQRFEPLQQFADFMTTSFGANETIGYTWLTWVLPSDTWNTIPWTSWAAIPNATVPVMILGSVLGDVFRFGFDSADAGKAIAYGFTSSLQRLNPNVKQLPNVWDIFFAKQAASEQVTTQISVLAHPTGTPRQVIGTTWDVGVDTPQGFYPGANAPRAGFAYKLAFQGDVPQNEDVYLQMTLQGTTKKRLVKFGGSECFGYPEQRA